MSVCSDYYPGWHRSILSSAFYQSFLCRSFLSGSHILDDYSDLFLSVSFAKNGILAIFLTIIYTIIYLSREISSCSMFAWSTLLIPHICICVILDLTLRVLLRPFSYVSNFIDWLYFCSWRMHCFDIGISFLIIRPKVNTTIQAYMFISTKNGLYGMPIFWRSDITIIYDSVFHIFDQLFFNVISIPLAKIYKKTWRRHRSQAYN